MEKPHLKLVPAPAIPAASPATGPHGSAPRPAFTALVVGSIGVVFGDIGTSPLYAFKESISHVVRGGAPLDAEDVLGVVSLMFWALMIVVTFKYVVLLMRFDNKGEGGVLALAALAQRLLGTRTAFFVAMGVLGAALFYGDAMLTPAISVLSAIEGLTVLPSLQGHIDPFIVPIAVGVLLALFLVQDKGTALVGAWFGPICIIWFLAIGGLGALQVMREPRVLGAVDPLHALSLAAGHPILAFVLLGSVFLTVTGAEALYADMGHFGRAPIGAAWLFLVLPALTLNYMGQGALVLQHPATVENPFFLLAPASMQPALVALATAATIIASQAVISGAFSLTQQAIQLGFLPRLRIVQTSAEHIGQIFMPQVNLLLLIGVFLLVVIFKSSSALASAYGISVIGAMITSSVLAIVVIRKVWKKPLWVAIMAMSPFILVETIFLASNMLKLFSGGFVPLLIATALVIVMWTWVKGSRLLRQATRGDEPLVSFLNLIARHPPHRVRGAAVFLTSEPDVAPTAMMHNLKHNQVLHERIIIACVRTAPEPRVPEDQIASIEHLTPDVDRVTLTYGFMQDPNVSRGLTIARAKGLQFDPLKTSFFISKRSLSPRSGGAMPRWQDLLYIYLSRNATNASTFFHIPAARTVELGSQLSI